jgi:predicted MPP superfamily phosphohydrolase
VKARRPRKWLAHKLLRRPYADETGRKRFIERLTRAQPHQVRTLRFKIAGWPQRTRPLRLVFLSDLHCGSHSGDVARLAALVEEANAHKPDLALLGGDFVNMQLFGGGRVPPQVIAAALGKLDAPLGRFAVLGNHDVDYGARDVLDALRRNSIIVLHDEKRELRIGGTPLDIVGIADARIERARAREVMTTISATRPALVLAHDPWWFTFLPDGPHLMLSGHTHGGQIRLPGIGALTNKSWAPMHWTYGLVSEGAKRLYVTSGIGTSGVPIRIGIPPEFVVLEIAGS